MNNQEDYRQLAIFAIALMVLLAFVVVTLWIKCSQ